MSLGLAHPGSGMEKFVEKQMRCWEIARSQHRAAGPTSEPALHDFVCVSQTVGSGGTAVAQALGDRLGWPVFDRQLLQEMASGDETRTQIYKSMDERDLGLFEEMVRSLTQRGFIKNDYYHRLVKTVVMLGRQWPAVFLGRGIDLILPADQGLRVKIVAPWERCVEQFAETRGMGLEPARREAEQIEADRASFVRQHFGIEPDEPTRFDLILNLGRLTVEQAVNLIVSAAKLRGIEPQN